MKIFYYPSRLKDGRDGYCWAWKESLDKKVFGWASSLDDVMRRTAKIFPDCEVQLIAL